MPNESAQIVSHRTLAQITGATRARVHAHCRRPAKDSARMVVWPWRWTLDWHRAPSSKGYQPAGGVASPQPAPSRPAICPIRGGPVHQSSVTHACSRVDRPGDVDVIVRPTILGDVALLDLASLKKADGVGWRGLRWATKAERAGRRRARATLLWGVPSYKRSLTARARR